MAFPLTILQLTDNSLTFSKFSTLVWSPSIKIMSISVFNISAGAKKITAVIALAEKQNAKPEKAQKETQT